MIASAEQSTVVADLRRVLDTDRVRDGVSELSLYRHDASHMEGQAVAVCFPTSTAEVQACVAVANRHCIPFVARGSGTGLAGGAVPPEGAVVVSTTKMNRVLSADPLARRAWREPGVLNLDLSRHVARHGLHFAPDPSSQQTCSIGGNVANNSGGPHCLSEGVTAAHILALEVVLPDGTVTVLGGEDPEPAGYDLRGAFVGSEGMFGIATKICVRLTPDPPATCTMLMDFDSVEAGASTVSAVIAAGIVPAAMEMMDRLCLEAVEAYIHAGLPLDAATALLVEVVGLPHGVDGDAALVRRIATDHGVRHVRIAGDDEERALLWKGRKSAFGAIARIKPNYYLHDTVVPRTKLVEVLRRVYEIADAHDLITMNVFHAGDGNLHPLLVFDRREPGVWPGVMETGHEIIETCIAAGGVLTGEHGVGIEKRDLMPLVFSPDDLDAQARLRDAFDPDGVANPRKVLPRGSRCGDLQRVPDGAWI